MKFTCDKILLNEAINAAIRAVPQKSSFAALEGILITAFTNEIKITGFDLNIGIECIIEAQVEESGNIVVKANMLSEIVRKLSNDTVFFSSDKNGNVSITCGPAKIDIVGIGAEEFPELFSVSDLENRIEMPENMLKSMIRQTLFAVSVSESKPVHTGSMFEIKDGTLKIISVDGIRLAIREEKLLTPTADISFVIPGKTLSEILKLLKDEDNIISIKPGEKHIMFEIGNIILVSRLLSGDFLNYRNVIPAEHKIETLIEVRNFLECIERASLVINEKIKAPIRCFFDYDIIKLYSKTASGSAYDELPATVTGGTLEIGFNNRFMIEALRACESEKVRIEMNSSLTPIVLRPEKENDTSFLFLVLPVRLKIDE